MDPHEEHRIEIRRPDSLPELSNTDDGAVGVDVYRTENYVVVEAGFPGRRGHQFTVFLVPGSLLLTATALPGEASRDGEREFLRRELPVGDLHRHVDLPDDRLDLSAAEAHYADGVLTVSLPSKERAAERRQLRQGT